MKAHQRSIPIRFFFNEFLSIKKKTKWSSLEIHSEASHYITSEKPKPKPIFQFAITQTGQIQNDEYNLTTL